MKTSERIVATDSGTRIYCTRCDALKPEADFAANASSKTGRQSGCRDCVARLDLKRHYGRGEPTRVDSAGKSCLKCDVYKPFSEYGTNKFGLFHVCKACLGTKPQSSRQEASTAMVPAARPVERAPLPASMMAMMFGSGGDVGEVTDASAPDDFLAMAQMMAGTQLDLFALLLKARGSP